MERYIDAENMKKEVLKRSTSPLNEWDTWGVLNVLDMVETEDVAPVIHAHWILFDDNKDIWDCSNCKVHVFVNVLKCEGGYCPRCGAKMDGEVEKCRFGT